MPDYHESQAREVIRSVVAGVPAVGVVHDYERYADDWPTLQAMYQATLADGTTRLQGWSVGLTTVNDVQETFGAPAAAGTDEVSYQYTIRGYYAVSDADASEKALVTLAMAVKKALDDAPALHSSRKEAGAASEFYGPPCPQARFDYRMFGDVLVHYVEIDVTPMEVI